MNNPLKKDKKNKNFLLNISILIIKNIFFKDYQNCKGKTRISSFKNF